MPAPMRFGTFTPPITRPDQDPTWALERQLETVEWMDRIGYDEAWFGEHHNGGWELICSPEIFIAAASQRTKHIKLGTGVTTLPYHHPFIVAERMVLLDHMTRGRVIFGAGPGSLSFDAHLMGLDYQENRRRQAEALDAITQLLRSDEPINMKTDWFTLVDAELQLKPYSYPCFEISTAGTSSPSGPRMSGRLGLSLLTIAASSEAGFDALRNTWEIVEAEAKQHNQTVSREGWRLVSFYHLADTEEQARKDVRYGLTHLLRYLSTTTPLARELTDIYNLDLSIDELNKSGLMVIGTVDMLKHHLERFQEQTGGFGGFLGFGHDMADREATLHSHELVIRDVAPQFRGSAHRQQENFKRLSGMDVNWSGVVEQAQAAAQAKWDAEKGGATAAT